MNKKRISALALALGMAIGSSAAMAAPESMIDFSNLAFNDDTSPIEFSLYLDYDWYSVDTWGKDEVSQYITETTGVSFDAYKSSDRSELGVLLAADDLPDVIFTDNLVQRFEDSDVCYPWDELIEQYDPNFYTNAHVGELEILNNTAADGHIYTFKTHFHYWKDPLDYPSYGDAGLYVREDVLKQLGMTTADIDSIEKLIEVFDMVNEKKAELGIVVLGIDYMAFFIAGVVQALYAPLSQSVALRGLEEFHDLDGALGVVAAPGNEAGRPADAVVICDAPVLDRVLLRTSAGRVRSGYELWQPHTRRVVPEGSGGLVQGL